MVEHFEPSSSSFVGLVYSIEYSSILHSPTYKCSVQICIARTCYGCFWHCRWAILCLQLRLSFGLDGSALAWFQSYLRGRSQYVRRGVLRSSSVQLICGVPQGSVLGPILFIMYIADLVALIDKHGFCPHLYADDTQIYGSTRHSAVNDLQRRLSACIDDVYNWMQSKAKQSKQSKAKMCNGRRHVPLCPASANKK